jgi:P-type E1-E2 ATPase
LRPKVGQVLQRLRSDGIKEFHLLSEDSDRAMSPLAASLGFETYRAAVSPVEKADFVEALSASDRQVAVGGVNDALALAKAHVGIAMGAGGGRGGPGGGRYNPC